MNTKTRSIMDMDGGSIPLDYINNPPSSSKSTKFNSSIKFEKSNIAGVNPQQPNLSLGYLIIFTAQAVKGECS